MSINVSGRQKDQGNDCSDNEERRCRISGKEEGMIVPKAKYYNIIISTWLDTAAGETSHRKKRNASKTRIFEDIGLFRN